MTDASAPSSRHVRFRADDIVCIVCERHGGSGGGSAHIAQGGAQGVTPEVLLRDIERLTAAMLSGGECALADFGLKVVAHGD